MTEPRARYTVPTPSSLEATLILHLRGAGLFDLFEREATIIPGRRFRFDFVCHKYRIAVEVNGGTWSKMGHSTGSGIARDYEKSNEAQMLGWLCLAFDGSMVRDGRAIATIERAIKRAKDGEI